MCALRTGLFARIERGHAWEGGCLPRAVPAHVHACALMHRRRDGHAAHAHGVPNHPRQQQRAHPSESLCKSREPRATSVGACLRAAASACGTACAPVPPHTGMAAPVPLQVVEVLNELVIDRGSSSFLTNIECYEKGRYITRVQADGIMLATPTGACLAVLRGP